MRIRLAWSKRALLGTLFKLKCFGRAKYQFGRAVLISGGAWVSRGVAIEFEDDVYVGRNAHFGTSVKIGPKSMIASGVSFVGGDHRITSRASGVSLKDSGRGVRKGVVVGPDAWIGHGAILIDGVSIGHGAIVGAGAVVTKNVGDFEVVAGNPARLLYER